MLSRTSKRSFAKQMCPGKHPSSFLFCPLGSPGYILILMRHINLCGQDKTGRNALHVAAQSGSLACLQLRKLRYSVLLHRNSV
jgi:hypothetical protein